MKNFNEAKNQTLELSQFLNFRKASPEAMNAILNATNAELEEAAAQKRFPTFEGVHRRLFPSMPVLQ